MNNNTKRWMLALTATLLALCLCACSGESAEKAPAEPPADTWGAMNGMSGTVAYTDDEAGRHEQIVLTNDATGGVWHTLSCTYSGVENGLHTYDADGNALYNLYSALNAEGVVTSQYGSDVRSSSSTCQRTFNASGQVESSTLYETNRYSECWWIVQRESPGKVLRVDVYYKDGALLEEYIFQYDPEDASRLADVKQRKGGVTAGWFRPEYDDQNRLSRLTDEEAVLALNYDESGRLLSIERTYRGKLNWSLSYEYGESGLRRCVYHNEDDFVYEYDADGNLVQ